MPRKRSRRYILSDARQLEAVVSPVRHQILRTLSVIGPSTIAELAGHLERSPESLYYHVRALQKVGLVEEVEARGTQGRKEAVFDVIARGIFTDPTQTSTRYIEAMKRSAASLLRLADRQLQRTLDQQKADGSQRPPTYRSMQYHSRLTPASVRELNKLLDQVGEFMAEHDDPDGSMISLTVACAPVRPRN